MNPIAKELSKFASVLYEPGDDLEIRLLPSGQGIPQSFECTAADLPNLAGRLLAENHTGFNIFAGANPRKAPGLKGDANVALARTVFADFDSTTIDIVRQRITATGLPTPTLTVNSGHGVHCFWRLKQPIIDLTVWTSLQRRLAAALQSDPKICNPERIMRLPGFKNLKEPVAVCGIVETDPARRYDLADIRAVLDRSTIPVVKTQLAPPLPEKIPSGQRNQTLTSAAGTMRRRGMSEASILAALRIENEKCEPPLADEDLQRIADSVGRYSPADPTESKYQWKPFPSHLLPVTVREFVRQLAGAIGCDPAMVALPLLSSLASAIGDSAQIKIKDSWFEPSIIWSGVIASSGCKKSPAMRAAMRGATAKQKRLSDEFKEKRKAYEHESAKYNAMEKSARPVDKPQPPMARHVLVSDVTLEALADRLQNSPSGLLLGRDELSGWVTSFGEYKGGKGSDVQGYLSMFSAAPLKVDRKTGDQTTIFIERPNVSITGTIQPEILKRVFTQEFFENGLAARFLFAMPPEPIGGWTDSKIDLAIQGAVDSLFESLYSRSTPHGPQTFTLTPEALELFKAFVNAHAKEMASIYSERLRAAWSKLEGYCARFALVLQIVADAVDGRFNSEVSASTMQNAIELIGWFKHEARRIYSILHGDQEADEQDSLIGWICRKGERVTARQLMQHSRQYRSNAAAATAALQALVDDGLGHWEYPPPDPRGGSPSPVFVLGKKGSVAAQSDDVPQAISDSIEKTPVTTPPSTISPRGSVTVTAVTEVPKRSLPPPRRSVVKQVDVGGVK